MIRVTYAEDSGKYALSVDGHAGYAEHGQDIICAACSGITFALLAYLEENQKHITDVQEQIVESGRFCIVCKGAESIETAFHMALLGLKKISSLYPDHVTITYSGIASDSRE